MNTLYTESCETVDYRELVQSLLPVFILAGDYALSVQSRVEATTKSAEGTIFSQAVTTADTSIQGLFEIALLPIVPGAAFFGEERSVLQNERFFDQESPLRITLDPINHTLAFIDGHQAFDIILTVSNGDYMKAAVVYLPAYGEFYIGIANQGAFTTTRAEVKNNHPWQQRNVNDSQAPVLIYNSPEVRAQIPPHLEVIDLAKDYQPQGPWTTTISGILRGQLSAYYRPNAHIIDWGAIAFIVECAGGIVSDLSGSVIPSYWQQANRRIPSLLVSTSERIHSELLGSIR